MISPAEIVNYGATDQLNTFRQVLVLAIPVAFNVADRNALAFAPARFQTSIAPIPTGGVYRYPWAGSKRRLPAADPDGIAGTGRGATKAFQTAFLRPSSAAIFLTSLLF